MCKFIGKSNERILCKLSKSKILRLYSIVYVAMETRIRLDSSSNIVGAAHAHHAWFTKTCGLYPSHDALQVSTLLGVVASVCTPLPTCTQQLPSIFRCNSSKRWGATEFPEQGVYNNRPTKQ